MGNRSFVQLRAQEREEISIGIASGLTCAELARRLGRARSTVSRELWRHRVADVGYRSFWAHSRSIDASRRKGRRGKLRGGELTDTVHQRLLDGLSPEQVSRALARDFGDNAAMQVSHETIYQAIYVMPRNGLKARLLEAGLRQGHEKRRPQSRLVKSDAPRVRFADGLSIHQRPEEVDDRAVPGHWEGDLIKGEKNRSEVGVLLERQTRRVLLTRLPDARAESVRQAFGETFKLQPPRLRKTLTYDQGSEMAEHARLTSDTGIEVYFADAHSPWQKGAIENANGLLRQYLPKGTNLAKHTQAQLDEIAEKLNNRPRECLGWRTPNEAWAELLVQNGSVA